MKKEHKNIIEITFKDKKVANFGFTAKHPTITFKQYPLLHTFGLMREQNITPPDPSNEIKHKIDHECYNLSYQEVKSLYAFICAAVQSVNHSSDDIKSIKLNEEHVEWKIYEYQKEPIFKVAGTIKKLIDNIIYQNNQYEIDHALTVVDFESNNNIIHETNRVQEETNLNGDCIVWESLN